MKEISTTTVILIPNSELSSGSDPDGDDGDGGGVDGPGGEEGGEFEPEPKPEEVEDACEVSLMKNPLVWRRNTGEG